jgi:RNA polymerase sigma-70 factor, ECF subfamily
MNMRHKTADQSESRLLSDESLMTLVKEGQSDALAVLFSRYRCLVLNVAWRILRDVGEAEDLVQSVFLEILRSADRFDAAKGSVKSWILQYAYHRSFNRKEYLNLRGISNRSEHPYPSPEIPSESRCGSFEMFESQRLAQEILGKLNRSQRKIFELAFYEGLSMRETAVRTGESFDSVRHQYYRAISTVRSVMRVPPNVPLPASAFDCLSASDANFIPTESGAPSARNRDAGATRGIGPVRTNRPVID